MTHDDCIYIHYKSKHTCHKNQYSCILNLPDNNNKMSQEFCKCTFVKKNRMQGSDIAVMSFDRGSKLYFTGFKLVKTSLERITCFWITVMLESKDKDASNFDFTSANHPACPPA